MSVSHKNVTQGVNIIGKSWNHQTTWWWEKFSRFRTDNGSWEIYIHVKSPDEYPWQGRNSFNSETFVIHVLQKLWTLNYRSPLLSSQFLPALKWLLKSSLTVLHEKNFYKSEALNDKWYISSAHLLFFLSALILVHRSFEKLFIVHRVLKFYFTFFRSHNPSVPPSSNIM